MAWTKDQERAINEYGHNIIDSAGAGSGKTAVLSERVRHFVNDKNYKLSEFLLLTFTRLAAGEMKDRIRKKLEEISSSEAEFVDTSDITTFDSFANSIVKKYHYLIGVSKDVGIVDSNVISVRKRNIIDEIFERKYVEGDKDFEEMVAKFCFKDDIELRELALKLQVKADLELDKQAFFDNFIEDHFNDRFIDHLIEEVSAKLEKKRTKLFELSNDLPDELSKKGGLPYNEEIHEIFLPFFNSSGYEDLISNYPLDARLPNKPRSLEDEYYVNAINLFKDYHNEVKKYIGSLPKNKEEFRKSIKDNEKYARVLLDISKEMDERQYAYKQEKEVYEFQDIAKMALDLISNNEEVREELKNHYKMIMIDEYQDTSALQEAFISLIANHNVYMVGDIKQSIYAFRNARSDIFANKYAKYKAHDDGEVIDMNKNFRSRREVLEDINTIFSRIMTLDIGGADYQKDHVIEYGLLDYLKADNPLQNNHAEFIVYDMLEEEKDKAEKEARIIAEDIIEKINSGYTVFKPGKGDIEATKRPCEFKDFCILMDRGTAFETYKKVFTDYQIPLFVEQDEDIKSNVIIKLLTNLLIIVKSIRLNAFDDDFKLAFLSIGRSFIYQMSDKELYLTCKNNSYLDTKVYQDIKMIMDSWRGLSNYELLNEIIFRLDIYHKLVLIGNVEKNSLYLDTFTSYLKQMSDLDYSLDDFITYLSNVEDYGLKITLSSTGSSTNSVRIMNIHKSKGLEFPIVYFSGLTKKFNDGDKKAKFNVSPEYGITFPMEEDEKYVVKTLIDEKASEEDLSEKIRLLYVALTRTREKMIFVTPKENKMTEIENAKSFDNLLRPLMGEFKVREYDDEKAKPVLNIKESKLIHEKVDIDEIKYSYRVKDISQASKHLKLNTSNYLLDYGTYLHEVMEVTDFVNPNYSLIHNQKAKEIVKKFLAQDLLKNVSKAKIYKEYAFESEANQGIIDLFLVYDDHIDLIDYKTKNIKDENYGIQIGIYKDFLEKTFKKPVSGYLYSLLDGEFNHIA